MFELLQYYSNLIRYRSRSDFLDMGFGIEARYRRCKKFWEPHLKLSRDFVSNASVGGQLGGKAAILGAGRLFDLDLATLLERFETVDLFDADPGVLPAWKRAARKFGSNRIGFHLGDLTGALDEWTTILDGSCRNLGSGELDRVGRIANTLSNLPAPRPTSLSGFRYVASLNLLSQIPIYWRDRVMGRIRKAGIQLDGAGDPPEAINDALNESARRLEQGTTTALLQSGAQSIVAISDTDFFYYRPDVAEWQCEKAITTDLVGALASRYRLERADSWLWHIAPCGVEQQEFGIIHRVGGWEFSAIP